MTGVGDSRFGKSYYDRYYTDYRQQNPPRKLAFYRSWVEQAAAGSPTRRILEIGCAFGLFLEALSGWERCGVDVSEYAISSARERVPGARFAVADVGHVPFEGPFDVIVAFDVLEHVPDLAEARREIAARLRPGGHLFYVVPVYDGPTGPVVRLLDRDPTHVHKESRNFWLDWAAPAFRIADWTGIYRYRFPVGPYVHVHTKRLRRFSSAIAILAQAPSEDLLAGHTQLR